MTVQVAEQSAYSLLLSKDAAIAEQSASLGILARNLSVAEQSAYVAILNGTRVGISSQTAFLALFDTNPPTPLMRRRVVSIQSG